MYVCGGGDPSCEGGRIGRTLLPVVFTAAAFFLLFTGAHLKKYFFLSGKSVIFFLILNDNKEFFMYEDSLWWFGSGYLFTFGLGSGHFFLNFDGIFFGSVQNPDPNGFA